MRIDFYKIEWLILFVNDWLGAFFDHLRGFA
jgi:hypothetical protein